MSDFPCICTSLRQAALAATQEYDDALRPSGLKVTMYRLLKRIRVEDGASISDLSRAVGLDRSTLGRNLRVLERQGLVTFSAAPDDRIRAVGLTERGAAALQRAEPLWQAAQARMTARLGPEADALLALLQRARIADDAA